MKNVKTNSRKALVLQPDLNLAALINLKPLKRSGLSPIIQKIILVNCEHLILKYSIVKNTTF